MNTPPAARIADACVLINLYATGRFAELLAGLTGPVLAAEQSLAESLSIREPDPNTGGVNVVPADLGPHLQNGGLVAVSPTPGAELALFVQLTARLGDGEAASITIAAHRGFGLATDDRRARRIAREVAASMPLYTTAQLLREAAEQLSLQPPDVGQMLRAIRTRARFEPPADDPERAWWMAFVTA